MNAIEAEIDLYDYDMLMTKVDIAEENIETVIDTGASMSVILEQLVKKLNLIINKQ